MPDALRRLRAPLVALGLALAGPALSGPDPVADAMAARLTALETRMADAGSDHVSAATLLRDAGFDPHAGAAEPVAVAAVPRAADPLEMRVLDVRLALAMLAQSFGAETNQGVLNAMGQGPFEALVVHGGRATLEDLRMFAVRLGLQQAEDGPFVLRVPVIVWDGASLDIGPGETLRLSRWDGAFVVNFGDLRVRDSEIVGWGAQNTGTPSFRPFVVTSGGGTVDVANARLTALGFGRTLKFGGFNVVNNPLVPLGGTSRIRASRFDDVQSVTVSSAHGIELRSNRFEHGEAAPIEIRMTRGAIVAGNLFVGDAPANAIRLLSGSHEALILGNVVLRGDKTGIAVRGGSNHARIENNVVWDRYGGGITVDRSHCAVVRENTVIQNRRKGIELRGGAGALVAGNLVSGNRSAAVWVSGQPDGALTRLEGNRLARNGAGISTAAGATVDLVGVDMSDQFPRFLGGDVALQSRQIVTGDLSSVTVTLASAGKADLPLADCGPAR